MRKRGNCARACEGLRSGGLRSRSHASPLFGAGAGWCPAADLVGDPDPWRRTASDYEAFITSLCGIPPGPERDKCLRCLTAQLVGLYTNLGLTPPPGLVEFSERIGR